MAGPGASLDAGLLSGHHVRLRRPRPVRLDAKGPSMSLRRACHVLLLFAAAGLPLAPGVSDGEPSPSPVDDAILKAIQELRAKGRYDTARQRAEELLAARRSRSAARPDEVLDARLLVEALTAAEALPFADRAKLVEADRLRMEVPDCFEKGRYREALDRSRREVEIRNDLQDRLDPDVIAARGDLGLVQLVLGDLDDAQVTLEAALAAARGRLGPDHPKTITILNDFAGVTWQRGDLKEAARLNAQVLQARRRVLGDENSDVAVSLNNLGLVLMEAGDANLATTVLRESLAMKRRLYGSGSAEVAKGLNNLAAALNRCGDREEAVRDFRESFDIVEKALPPDHPSIAAALNNVGTLTDDREEALDCLRRALEIQRKNLGPDHLEVVKSLVNMSFQVADRGEAARLLREAVAIQVRAGRGDHPETHQANVSLGTVLLREGDCMGAHEALSTGAAGLERTLGGAHWYTVAGLSRLADWQRQCGSAVVAESLLSRASDVADAARRRTTPGVAQPGRLVWEPYATAAETHRRLAGVRLELGRDSAAWVATEEGLARATRELVVDSRERFLSKPDAALQDSLSRELVEQDHRARTLRRSKPASDRQRTDAEAALLETQADWTRLQLRLEQDYPVPEGQAASLEVVRAALRPGSAILGWLDFPEGDLEQRYAYVVRDRGPVRWVHLAPEPASDSVAVGPEAGVRALLADANAPRRALRDRLHEVWRERVQPILPALDGVTELHVVPTGGMLGIPLEALIDEGGASLGDRFAVVYIPSATLHVWLETRRPRVSHSPRKALVIGDPDYGTGLQVAAAGSGSLARLPATRQEALRIARVFPTVMQLVGADASEARLLELSRDGELAGFDVIHIAAHALVNDVRPEESGIVLSTVADPDPLSPILAGHEYCDGVVTGEEVMRHWDLGADLVSLSACRTGRGCDVAGEGYVGLTQAFLMAGARTLLVSLWDVDDSPTALLMQRFFEDWTGGAALRRTKAEALQEAQHWLRTYRDASGECPFAAPYYWSGFVLVGSAD